MAIITTYPNDDVASNNDRYLTVNDNGETRLTSLEKILDAVANSQYAATQNERFEIEHNPDGTHKATPDFRAMIADIVNPVGKIDFYYGTEATFNADPARVGWLFAVKNRSYSKTTYSRLWNHMKAVDSGSVVDTTTGNFRFHDKFFGRVFVGLDAADTDFSTLGKTVGSKTHKLTVSEMPSHTHNIAHGEKIATSSGGGGYWGGTSGHSTNTNSTGGGDAHNNIQPTITTNILVKY